MLFRPSKSYTSLQKKPIVHNNQTNRLDKQLSSPLSAFNNIKGKILYGQIDFNWWSIWAATIRSNRVVGGMKSVFLLFSMLLLKFYYKFS